MTINKLIKQIVLDIDNDIPGFKDDFKQFKKTFDQEQFTQSGSGKTKHSKSKPSKPINSELAATITNGLNTLFTFISGYNTRSKQIISEHLKQLPQSIKQLSQPNLNITTYQSNQPKPNQPKPNQPSSQTPSLQTPSLQTPSLQTPSFDTPELNDQLNRILRSNDSTKNILNSMKNNDPVYNIKQMLL